MHLYVVYCLNSHFVTTLITRWDAWSQSVWFSSAGDWLIDHIVCLRHSNVAVLGGKTETLWIVVEKSRETAQAVTIREETSPLHCRTHTQQAEVSVVSAVAETDSFGAITNQNCSVDKRIVLERKQGKFLTKKDLLIDILIILTNDLISQTDCV